MTAHARHGVEGARHSLVATARPIDNATSSWTGQDRHRAASSVKVHAGASESIQGKTVCVIIDTHVHGAESANRHSRLKQRAYFGVSAAKTWGRTISKAADA